MLAFKNSIIQKLTPATLIVASKAIAAIANPLTAHGSLIPKSLGKIVKLFKILGTKIGKNYPQIDSPKPSTFKAHPTACPKQ